MYISMKMMKEKVKGNERGGKIILPDKNEKRKQSSTKTPSFTSTLTQNTYYKAYNTADDSRTTNKP